jgi:hypothetical protein
MPACIFLMMLSGICLTNVDMKYFIPEFRHAKFNTINYFLMWFEVESLFQQHQLFAPNTSLRVAHCH